MEKLGRNIRSLFFSWIQIVLFLEGDNSKVEAETGNALSPIVEIILVKATLCRLLPSKHGAFTQCCFNVGAATKTGGHHWNSTGWISRVYWGTILSNNRWYLTQQVTALSTIPSQSIPEESITGHWPLVGITMVHHLRRWPNISPYYKRGSYSNLRRGSWDSISE